VIRRPSPATRLGLGGLLALVVGGLVAADVVVTGEVAVTEALNDLPGPVIDLLGIVMQLGSRLAIVLIAVVAAVLVDRHRLRVGAVVLLAGGLAWIGAELVKESVERPRPRAAGAVVDLHDDADGSAYPSAHVSVATGSLAAAALATRRHPSAALAIGAAVGVGRMAAGVHLPLDVVGGLGMGAASAALVVVLADR